MRTQLLLLAALGLVSCVDDPTDTGGRDAPGLGSVSLVPSAPTTEDTVTVVVVGASEGAALSYAWHINGQPVPGTDTLASPFARGDVIGVSVTASDGALTSAPIATEVTAVNARPVVTSVTITPTTPASTDVLTATATATDADGDVPWLWFEWSDGTSVIGHGPHLAPPWPRGTTITAVAVAIDETSTSEAVRSDPVTTANGAPAVPATPYLGALEQWLPTGLQCIAPVPADPDGDEVAVDIRFLRDGEEVDVQTSTGGRATLARSATAGGGVWTCEAMATDGEAVSDWSPPSAALDLSCSPAELTLYPTRFVSLDYATGVAYTDYPLQAYSWRGADFQLDLVGWMGFSLPTGDAIGFLAAELEVYAVDLAGQPELFVVQSADRDWTPADVTQLTRDGQVSEVHGDLVAGWNTFEIDVSAWTEAFTAFHTEVTLGIDNLPTLYSYGYFDTGVNAPRLHLTVCEAP